MICSGMAKKLLGGAVGALGLAVGAVRHVAWYVSYQLDGTARDEGPSEESDA
jgi:hypothetical protein